MVRKIKTFENFLTDITGGVNHELTPEVVDLGYFGGVEDLTEDDEEGVEKQPPNRTGREDGPKNKFKKAPIRVSVT